MKQLVFVLTLAVLAISAVAADKVPVVDQTTQIELMALDNALLNARLAATPYIAQVNAKAEAERPVFNRVKKTCDPDGKSGLEPVINAKGIFCEPKPQQPAPQQEKPQPQQPPQAPPATPVPAAGTSK